jgi:hypothetical protein
MKIPQRAGLFLAGILLVSSIGSTQASTVVFSDDFSDGLGNWNFYNTSSTGTEWSNPAYENPPMTGKVMYNTGSFDTNTNPLAQWSTVSLTNIGDSITISFDLLINTTDGSKGIQIALFNTATSLSGNYFGSNLGYTPVSNANGYVIQQFYGTSTTGLQYRELADNTKSASLYSQQPVANIGNNTVNNISITLTMVSTGLLIEYSSAGNVYDSFLDTTPTSYDFNTLQIQTNIAARVDNVLVTTNIPESRSTAILLGIGAATLLLMRKREKNRA